MTWNRVLLTLDSCGLLCSTLRRFITSRHDVGARRDFLFFPVSNSLAKNRLSSYIYGPLRPPNDPDPHARTHTMRNAHHIHDLSPPRLAIGPPRPEPDKDAQRPSFSFLFVLIGSDIAFFYRQLESPNPITRPSFGSPARPLTRLSVFTWPSPCVFFCLLPLRLFCVIFHLPISLHPLIYLTLFFCLFFLSFVSRLS